MKSLQKYITESLEMVNEDATMTVGKFIEEITDGVFMVKNGLDKDEFIEYLNEPYFAFEWNGVRLINKMEPDFVDLIIKNYKTKVRVKKSKDRDSGTKTWEFDLDANHIACIIY